MNSDQDEQPAVASPEEPRAVPAIAEPEAVTHALGGKAHLIRTQFVPDRLASGQCTAGHITAMLEWERFVRDGMRINFASSKNWSTRLSPFDRRGINLELEDDFHVGRAPRRREAPG